MIFIESLVAVLKFLLCVYGASVENSTASQKYFTSSGTDS